MERIINALEEHAGELEEDLDTEISVLQLRANQALEYGEESRVYNLRRGEIRKQLEDLESVYDEAVAVLALGDQLDLLCPEEERNEEVRLAKEKWYESRIENPYEGSIGEAMDDHMERQREARNQDILSHSTPLLSLRNTLRNYEMLLYGAGEKIEGFDPDTPYSPQTDDAEFIEEGPEENPDEPLELTEYRFS